jgi:hypothetical protein
MLLGMAVVDKCRPASRLLRVGKQVDAHQIPVRRPAAGPTSDPEKAQPPRLLSAMPAGTSGRAMPAPEHQCPHSCSVAAAVEAPLSIGCLTHTPEKETAQQPERGALPLRQPERGALPLRQRRPCAASEVGGARGW